MDLDTDPGGPKTRGSVDSDPDPQHCKKLSFDSQKYGFGIRDP